MVLLISLLGLFESDVGVSGSSREDVDEQGDDGETIDGVEHGSISLSSCVSTAFWDTSSCSLSAPVWLPSDGVELDKDDVNSRGAAEPCFVCAGSGTLSSSITISSESVSCSNFMGLQRREGPACCYRERKEGSGDGGKREERRT